jgi:hypothetical protein
MSAHSSFRIGAPANLVQQGITFLRRMSDTAIHGWMYRLPATSPTVGPLSAESKAATWGLCPAG